MLSLSRSCAAGAFAALLLVPCLGLWSPSASANGGLTTAELVPADAADADAGWEYACDGTDEVLLEEINEAFRTGVGYGETWDGTICNQGLLVYGKGIRRIRTWEERRDAWLASEAEKEAAANVVGEDGLSARQRDELAFKMDQRFMSMFIPIVGIGALALCILLGAAGIVFVRTRKQILVDVGCPRCRTVMPFIVGESPQLFCPACGAACRVDIDLGGGTPQVAVVPL